MPFIISFVAGISTIIGYFFIYIKNSNKVLYLSLFFSSIILFLISMFDLLPDGLSLINSKYNIIISIMILIIFFMFGIILSSKLDNYIDSFSNSKLYRVGLMSMIAIIIHNVPEGIITYLTTSFDFKMGITLSIAIILHNIPEGVSISVPIYYSTNSKLKAFIYTFASGISEFIGSIVAFLFLRKFNSEFLIGILYSLIAGIMFYISVFDLLPAFFETKNKKSF